MGIYSCFIDLRKAFDCVNREMLMYKILNSGINGKMYMNLKTLYNCEKTKSCIRINDNVTDWFITGQGVKQGDSLSPVIFLLFINDLAQELAGMNVGTLFDQRKIPILMYADDIVLLSDSEKEMQTMLDHVHKWCKKWLMAVNLDKTKIVHFRKAKTPRSEYIYKYGSQPVEYANVYKYLGMYFDEHLTFEHNEEQLTLAGNRALGGIISKLKQNDCMSYEVYTKCVFTCVKPVIEYGSEIVGVYNHGKLERVINAAARAFFPPKENN